jgi:hypothetical protein
MSGERGGGSWVLLAIIKGVSNPDLVLGGATYHLKKTKPLSEAQKEDWCMVNIVRGIELWWSSRESANIFAIWGFNNRERNGIWVVPVPLATLQKSFQGKKP